MGLDGLELTAATSSCRVQPDDARFADALPGKAEHGRFELRSAQRHSGAGISGPHELTAVLYLLSPAEN